MANPKDQEKLLLFEITKSIITAIMSVGVQISNPKAKPAAIIEKANALTGSLLEVSNAEKLIEAWVQQKQSTKVAEFKITEVEQRNPRVKS
jgi:hypothetical protein